MDKDNSEKEYNSLEKSYRKLAKESKELQMKHEKIFVSLKKLKNEKNQISKDPNAISVALVASRRNFQDHLKLCTKEKSDLKKDIVSLQDFKDGKVAEERKKKKVEKKMRQRIKKDAIKTQSGEADTEEDLESTVEMLTNVDTSNPFEILKNPKTRTRLIDSDLKKKFDEDHVDKTKAETVYAESELAKQVSKEPPDPEVCTTKSESNSVLDMNANEMSEFLNQIVDNFIHSQKMTE